MDKILKFKYAILAIACMLSLSAGVCYLLHGYVPFQILMGPVSLITVVCLCAYLRYSKWVATVLLIWFISFLIFHRFVPNIYLCSQLAVMVVYLVRGSYTALLCLIIGAVNVYLYICKWMIIYQLEAEFRRLHKAEV